MKQTLKLSWVVFVILLTAFSISCKKKTTEPDVIASFTYKVDTSNFKKVVFTNASQNYSSVSWDFGDGSTSTEVNPTHTFAATGDFNVKLSTSGTNGSADSYTKKITIADPNAYLTMLVGDVSKTWKLLRVTTTGRYPLECGPWDHSTIWWAMGLNNNELGNRPCMLNDEWTFYRNGNYYYNARGDYWAEGNIFNPANICADTTSMLGLAGEDLSAWGGGMHQYVLTPGSAPTIKAVGMGAFIGFFKLGNLAETKVPLDNVLYNIIKLTDGTVDTLIVEGQYKWDATDGGYWRFTLVHYDNAADEPPIPGNKPNASFTYSATGLAVTFTNTSTDGATWAWDFGDNQTSTAQSPVHTYAAQGIYTVILTATNPNGSSTVKQNVFLGADLTTVTDANLQGAAWKVRAEELSIFVGPALGSSAWWVLPKAFMTGGTGTDDWTCITDDEFTFSAGGGFAYDTKGSTRNDGYFGTPNGCISDAGIAASGNGAVFGTCATHTYALTPGTATTTPIITLTFGASHAAFIGFYKGFYGGENTDGTKVADGGATTNIYHVMGYANSGTKEYLFVSVDISAAHDGSSAWSAILER